jgi:hypothetical protein
MKRSTLILASLVASFAWGDPLARAAKPSEQGAGVSEPDRMVRRPAPDRQVLIRKPPRAGPLSSPTTRSR